MGSVDSIIVQIALPRPLDKLFTYRAPFELKDKIKCGAWVRVPFGNSNVIGFVAEDSKSINELPKHIELKKLKEVLEVGDEEKIIPKDVFELCKFASRYYHAPLGELLLTAAPHSTLGLKTKKGARELKIKQILEAKRNKLSPEQETVFQELEALRKSPTLKPALLQGVTGSGKTEVYIELAHRVLKEGKSVLLLVPEIALTSQLQNRLSTALGEYVALWHSAVSDGKRRDETAAIAENKIRVVVGARSAVFAPLKNLGLIIVDEEHDATFKQEDRVRYHARDLAIVRAKSANALVVLGSATPSIETLERATETKYAHYKLENRFSTFGLPNIELVDLSEEPRVEGTQSFLAQKTLDQIQNTLIAGNQVMIFLNRRGFASFLLCTDCGEVKSCPHCSISLTVHKRDQKLKCHVCSYEEHAPDFCPKCLSTQLTPMGAGTESLEEELPRLIPEAKILRLDRDSVTSQTRLEKTLDEFRQKKSNVLLGTQMLAKGHDFPNVTLVVVILADALFRYPDFRAGERALQLLTQVSGRAGRGEKQGHVLIQTFSTEHPILQVLLKNVKADDYLKNEIALRKEFLYPPFSRLCRLRVENTDFLTAKKQSQELLKGLEENPLASNVQILGPSEAFLEKAKGKHRWDILIKSQKVDTLQSLVKSAKELSVTKKWSLLVDVDPYGLG